MSSLSLDMLNTPFFNNNRNERNLSGEIIPCLWSFLRSRSKRPASTPFYEGVNDDPREIETAMKCTVITVNKYSAEYLGEALRSVIAQREVGIYLQYIFIDGKSTDGSLEIIGTYRRNISVVVSS